MKFGEFEINVVSDGTFRLDGGAMFGIIPKPVWNRLIPADDKNRITLALDALLVRFRNKVVILEGGIGDKYTDKEKEIYAIDRRGGMLARLAELGVGAETVTDVIVSHLHFDHAGFLTRVEDGSFRPTFPKARYHVQKKHLEWAMSASAKDRGSFRQEDFEPLVEMDMVECHDGSYEFAENFKVFVSNGHTICQQHSELSQGDRSILFCGDLVPTSKHLGLPYNMGYDNYPLENVLEKDRLLARASKSQTMLYFYHDCLVKLVTVKEGKKGFEIDKVIQLEGDL